MVDVQRSNYFEGAKIPLRLACVTESGWPVVLSLWYLYQDGYLFCATPQSAKVVSYLSIEPRCAFEVAADEPPYCGVRGQAVATIDTTQGLAILERLITRYLGGTQSPLAQNLLNRKGPEVAIRLEPQNTFTWNFSNRMAKAVPESREKICPE